MNNPFPQATARQRLASVRTIRDLDALCRAEPSLMTAHADELVQAFLRIASGSQRPTHIVTLVCPTPAGWSPRSRTEASELDSLQHLARQWLWRMSYVAFGHKRDRLPPQRWFPFMAFPEDRDRGGNRVPPHYHVLLRLNETQASKFALRGADEWQKLLGLDRTPGKLYDFRGVSDEDVNPVTAYCTKQASDLWVLDRVIDPSQLCRFC
jgi:hypothetical protein